MKNSTPKIKQLGKLLCAGIDTSQNESSISASSIENDEEARLVINGEKVFRLWERQGQQTSDSRGPRNSTPIRHRLRGNKDSLRKSQDTGSLLNLASDQTFDSFWDVETSNLFKSRSENDVSVMGPGSKDRIGYQKITDYQKGTSKDSRRRPFQTLSHTTSDCDIYSSGNSSSTSDVSNVHKTPRYRVNVTGNMLTSLSRGALGSHPNVKSCADTSDSSVEEFLSRVDHDKLASLLDFCERVSAGCMKDSVPRNISFLTAVNY